jgi:hypothetical protein
VTFKAPLDEREKGSGEAFEKHYLLKKSNLRDLLALFDEVYLQILWPETEDAMGNQFREGFRQMATRLEYIYIYNFPVPLAEALGELQILLASYSIDEIFKTEDLREELKEHVAVLRSAVKSLPGSSDFMKLMRARGDMKEADAILRREVKNFVVAFKDQDIEKLNSILSTIMILVQGLERTIEVTDKAKVGKELGGIDLNPNLFEIETKGDGKLEFPKLKTLPQDFNINGLMPVIINITPISNLPFLLGLDSQSVPNTIGLDGAQEPDKIQQISQSL